MDGQTGLFSFITETTNQYNSLTLFWAYSRLCCSARPMGALLPPLSPHWTEIKAVSPSFQPAPAPGRRAARGLGRALRRSLESRRPEACSAQSSQRRINPLPPPPPTSSSSTLPSKTAHPVHLPTASHFRYLPDVYCIQHLRHYYFLIIRPYSYTSIISGSHFGHFDTSRHIKS